MAAFSFDEPVGAANKTNTFGDIPGGVTTLVLLADPKRRSLRIASTTGDATLTNLLFVAFAEADAGLGQGHVVPSAGVMELLVRDYPEITGEVWVYTPTKTPVVVSTGTKD